MGHSPKSLKPATFTPKSIGGLALWLDASGGSDLYTTDAGPVTAVSAPTDISGCVGWWDAADASTLKQNSNGTTAVSADGDPVGYWADKSASGFAVVQASAGLRPAYKPSGLNSLPSLLFDGTDDVLRVTPVTPVGNTGVTAFAVFRVVTAGAYVSPPLLLGSGPNARPYDRYHSSGENIVSVGSANGTATLSLRTQTTPFVHSMVMQKDGASSGVHRFQEFANGAGFGLVDITSTYSVASQVIGVGARADGATLLNAHVSEIVLFDGVLSATDRARIERYLAVKWGIAQVHANATTASDPVGYWRDRSGNNRHATQATGASRPTISATQTNGKNAVAFNGSSGTLVIANYAGESGVAGLTRYMVISQPSASGGMTGTGGAGGAFLHQVSFQGRFYAGSAYSSVDMPSYAFLSSGTRILGSVYDGSAASVAAGILAYGDGASLPQSATSGTLPASLSSSASSYYVGSNVNLNNFLSCRTLEVLTYNRALTPSERRRVERYLASKYGITLAPQVSNADAQDWVNRVYANGGTVLPATAAAVNQFCADIDAAGLRSLMYRLNLFCGTGLNACLVPLYRGPSLGGTQYGNTTDTNVGPFVSGDYVESAGLTGTGNNGVGAGSSKHLNTGLTPAAMPTVQSLHVGAYSFGITQAGPTQSAPIGIRNNTAPTNRWGFDYRQNYVQVFSGGGVLTTFATVPTVATNQHWLASRSSVSSVSGYINGVSQFTDTTDITASLAARADNFLVFAQNTDSNAAAFWAYRMGGYSIGAGLGATQAASLSAAMAAFNAAMGRS